MKEKSQKSLSNKSGTKFKQLLNLFRISSKKKIKRDPKSQLFNHDVFVVNFIAMILKKDVPSLVVAEILPILVFTAFYQSIEHLVVPFIFENLDTIEPMLHMISFHYHPCGIPLIFAEIRPGLI